MQQLLNYINQYYTLSNDAKEALVNQFVKITGTKNDYLIKEGQVCKDLYFLEKGSLRGYYNVDGKEITHWFGFENDFVTSFHSFITKEATVENIQLTEDAILWSIDNDSLKELYNNYHEIERLVRIAYEKYYIRLEERYVNAQFKTAKERYEDLINNTPHILQRMPLGFVASYLGISQETLSRIRGKI